MQLQFLGTGSAFVPITENYQSNMILKHDNGPILLIDCGSDIRHSLAHYNLGYEDIHSVFISHQHADHCGGLEWLAISRKFSGVNQIKPYLLVHPSLLQPLWAQSLSGGLETLEGLNEVSVDDFFTVQLSDEHNELVWEGVNLEIIQSEHFYNGPHLKPSFGLMITTSQTKVLISGDTRFMPELWMPYFEKADLIFQDCDTNTKNNVHANFLDLVTLPQHIKHKMWLYHYTTHTRYDAKAHGFQGFVKKGQLFEV